MKRLITYRTTGYFCQVMTAENRMAELIADLKAQGYIEIALDLWEKPATPIMSKFEADFQKWMEA